MDHLFRNNWRSTLWKATSNTKPCTAMLRTPFWSKHGIPKDLPWAKMYCWLKQEPIRKKKAKEDNSGNKKQLSGPPKSPMSYLRGAYPVWQFPVEYFEEPAFT